MTAKRRESHVWTWPIALYLYLGGLGAGITIVTVCLDLFLGLGAAVWLCPFVALVCLGLGSGLLIFELGRPWQFWRVFSRQKAVLTFGAWMVGILVVVDALYFSCWLAWFPWAGLGVLRAVIAVAALALGLGVLLYTGIELASMKSRVFWNTPALPVVFALGGLLNGCAADYLLVLVAGSPGFVIAPLQIVAQLVALPILLYAIAIFCFLTLLALMLYVLLMLTSAGPDARAVAQRWLKGRYALAFWLGLVVLGLVLPLVLTGLVVAGSGGFALSAAASELAVTAAVGPGPALAVAASILAALCAIGGGVFMRFLVVYSDDRRCLEGEADYWAHLPQGDEPFLRRNWG